MRVLVLTRLAASVAFCTIVAFAAPQIVFTHVTVIDTSSGASKRDQSVVISGSRITQVRNSQQVKPVDGSEIINATGKFMIPGLWDMHVHTFFGDWVPGGRDISLPLFVANGITGVRDMGSDLEPILQARSEIASHRLVGPRLIIAGPMLDGPKTHFPASIAIGTPEQGRHAVDMLKRRGVDFIKVQSYVPREAYFAIADECKKQQITFVGHVPDAIRASEAIAAGQKSFEHLIGIFEGSSNVEDQLLSGLKGPGAFLQTFNRAKEKSLIGLLDRNQTWQCPTLFWERGQWLVDAIDVTQDPNITYAPAFWRNKSWPKFKESILKSLATDPLPIRKQFVQHELDVVARLNAAGVPFLAGTDTPAGIDVIPGFSLHQELQRFVDAGFTPLQALQTATINPAKFFGKLNDLGTVEPGKLADLVLLEADPLQDIHGTQRIFAVVLDGHFYSSDDLQSIRERVKKKTRSN